MAVTKITGTWEAINRRKYDCAARRVRLSIRRSCRLCSNLHTDCFRQNQFEQTVVQPHREWTRNHFNRQVDNLKEVQGFKACCGLLRSHLLPFSVEGQSQRLDADSQVLALLLTAAGP